MDRKKQALSLFDKPVALRKDIIKRAAIESGIICNDDEKLFDIFWKKYKDILSEKETGCVILD